MGQVVVGTKCRFCADVVRALVPTTATKAEAAQLLDTNLGIHLMFHVDDFLYGEGGVFSGPVSPGGGSLRPADPPA